MRLVVRSRAQLSPFGMVLMSVPFLAAGVVLLAVAFGWLGGGATRVTAPPWVIGLAALVFLGGGCALLGMALGRPRAAAAGTAAIAVGVVALFHWVAFGSGPREFTSRTEALGARAEREVDERDGRVAFAAFALGMDAVLVAGAIVWWRRRRAGARPDGS